MVATYRAGSNNSLPSPAPDHAAQGFVAGRADRGIQPNIIQQIGHVIRTLCNRGDMAIVLVEQFFDFAFDLGDQFTVMKRGEVSFESGAAGLDRQTLFDAVMV